MHARTFLATGLTLLLLGACSSAPPGAINDPYEQKNRAVHAENVRLDAAVFGTPPRRRDILPRPLAQGMSNFGYNLTMPTSALNSLLQGRPVNALNETARFAINTTVGVGGIFDPAMKMGLYPKDADFGGTLHVWGAREGAYLELPFVGPSTERDLAGAVVDTVINPLNLLNRTARIGVAFGPPVGALGDRSLYASTVDPLLYGSADSYAATRLAYLQYRHNQIGLETAAGAAEIDPFADPFGDPYAE